ncbi:MAG: RNA 2',3'-cyclic phosphodiesterase [bacterium]
MSEIRTFIAVELSDEIKGNLSKVQSQLLRADADVRWVDPAAMHLTLKFIGNIPEDSVDAVMDALGESAKGISPFVISCGGLGFFPNERRPRVVWVGVKEGVEELRVLCRRIDENLVPLNIPPEEKEFTPHLTLGRVRSPKNKEALLGLLPKVSSDDLGSQTVESAALFKSDLTPRGAIHTVLGRVNLR